MQAVSVNENRALNAALVRTTLLPAPTPVGDPVERRKYRMDDYDDYSDSVYVDCPYDDYSDYNDSRDE